MDDSTIYATDAVARAATRAMEAVIRADDVRYTAMVEADIDALNRVLSDELSYTHSSAHRESKAEYLESLKSGRVRYQSVRRDDDFDLRLYGDIAVMNGTVLLKAVVDGAERILFNRFLSLWKRELSGWKMLAWASTPLPYRP